VFDVDKLRTLNFLHPDRGYLWSLGQGEYEFRGDGGALRVWQPPEKDHIYCIGADVAEGLEHGDYSSAHVIDARTHEVVAHWHGLVEPDAYGSEILYALGEWYHWSLLGVERNNHGLTTITALRDKRYKNLYRARTLGNTRVKVTEKIGFHTTVTTKPLAIDELARDIRTDVMHLHCEETAAEMRTFVREGNGKMHGSPHDDRVMSLAIANQMVKYAFYPEFQVERKPGPGTMGFLVERLLQQPGKTVRQPIGSYAVRAR